MSTLDLRAMATSTALRLETEHLTLRGHEVADLDASAAMWADAAVVRHIGGRPVTREASAARSDCASSRSCATP